MSHQGSSADAMPIRNDRDECELFLKTPRRLYLNIEHVEHICCFTRYGIGFFGTTAVAVHIHVLACTIIAGVHDSRQTCCCTVHAGNFYACIPP